MQESCLYLLSQTYGSNTLHCRKGRSQRLVLATQGSNACCRSRYSINEIKYFPLADGFSRLFIQLQGGAKRTHVFQIIVTLFIFNIKKLFQHQNNL